MTDIVRAGLCEVGTEVFYEGNECSVIGIDTYTVLGFKSRPWGFTAWKLDTYKTKYQQAMDNGFVYGWKISKDDLMLLANQPILIPDQICVECKLPAPHAKPNAPDNVFICSMCSVLKDIV